MLHLPGRMKNFRQHTVFRLLGLLLALHVLNFSVDSPDLYPDCFAEDLSLNDMESIVEIVLEKVLKIDNAVPEHDEPDDNGSISKTPHTFVLDAPLKAVMEPAFTEYAYPIRWSESCVSQYSHNITPPPPKA